MKKFRFQSVVGAGFILLFCLNILLLLAGIFTGSSWFVAVAIIVSVAQAALHDIFRRKNSVLRNYPIRKRLYFFVNRISPYVSEYLPGLGADNLLTRKEQELIAARASNIPTAIMAGSLSPDENNAEYIAQPGTTVSPFLDADDLKLTIGSAQCSQPYEMSLLNIGPISHKILNSGSLFALCGGAKLADCAINSGKAGINPQLVRSGADLIWQIAHEDYAFRKDGSLFNEELFQATATRPYIKMIEIVLPRQDATIMKRLWGNKMIIFLDRLRHLSGGKPIGIRLFNPANETIDAICQSMWNTRLHLDFATIDSSLSADGIDPLNVVQARNSAYLRSLSFFRRSIEQYKLETKLIASGGVVTEYDILKSVALGADACSSIVPMIMALGNPLFRSQQAGQLRVANFHTNTLKATAKLMMACGYKSLKDVNARDFFQKSSYCNIKSLHEIYFNQHPVKGPYLFSGLS